MTDKPEKPRADWEMIEREFRAGQLSIRQIADISGVTEGAIRKRAKRDQWTRALADKVREAVREKLVRVDGTQDGTQSPRASNAEIVEAASLRGLDVTLTHRRDISQLHGIKRVLADALAAKLNGGSSGVENFMGEKESPGDLLEKLSRVTARLIPLERQAFNLDAVAPPPGAGAAPGTAPPPIDPVEAARVYQALMRGGAA